jgi:hypothetical protein
MTDISELARLPDETVAQRWQRRLREARNYERGKAGVYYEDRLGAKTAREVCS